MTSFDTVRTYVSFYHNGTEWKASLSDDPRAVAYKKWCIEIPVPKELINEHIDGDVNLGEKVVSEPNWTKMSMEG